MSSTSGSSVSSSTSSSATALLYVAEPTIANCDIGTLKDVERTAVLDKVNAIRARHGLPPVAYNSSEDRAAAEAALYMVANKTLTNTPSASGLCYTSDVARLAANSNMYVYLTPGSTTQTAPSTQAVLSYLLNNGAGPLGPRRRLLNPFLGAVAFGRVDGLPSGSTYQHMASVLKVQGNEIGNVSTMSNDYVAYPYGIYPSAEFSSDAYLSFSAIASKTDASANGSTYVNFSGATITVTDGLTPLTVTDRATDYATYGLPNSLQWKVAGLQNNITYSVLIENVIVNGVSRHYSYSFTLHQEAVHALCGWPAGMPNRC